MLVCTIVRRLYNIFKNISRTLHLCPPAVDNSESPPTLNLDLSLTMDVRICSLMRSVPLVFNHPPKVLPLDP